MAGANIQAGIEIKAGVEGLENIKALSQQIEAAGVDTSELSAEFAKLAAEWAKASEQQSLIERYKQLKRELKDTGTEIAATTQRMNALEKEMAGQGTREQEKQFAALGAELDRLNARKKQLGGQLKTVTGSMNTAGISVKNLAATEKQLAADSEAAAKKLDKLTQEAQELKALADARVTLGIDTDDKARAEIQKVNQAYNDLKASGTLTQTELARASDLHRQKIDALESSLQTAKPTLAEVAGELQGVITKSAGLALVAREAMQFETAMAGVKKVVDGTPEQMGELSDNIKDLAGELGVVPAQLAEISAQGGQLGIPIEKLGQFTEMAAKMSVAFGITADEAGNAAATIANVFQLPIERVGELGDAINVLGNNTAAREKDIVAAMTRIGGNARQFGLAAEEAAALADAFIALGKPPEVAGTAINALLMKLQTAESQSNGFKDALSGLGMSAEQLAADIAAKPQQALTDFLKKLESLDKQSRALVLAEMFGTEYSDDIALLVGSLGEYEKALALVADKGKVVGAMQAEVAAALETSEAKINQAKASFSAAAATIGEALLPAISAAAQGAASVAEAVGSVAQEFPLLTQLITLYAGLRVGMQALQVATKLTGTTTSASFLKAEVASLGLRKRLSETTLAAAALNTELAKVAKRDMKIISGAIDGLRGKLSDLASKAGAVGTALTVGMGAGNWLYESTDWAKSLGDELARGLSYVDALFTDRTLEDVRKYFRTSSELLKENEEEKEKSAKADKERAEAAKQAAEEENARIAGLMGQYKNLKAEYDSNARSMAVLAAEGKAGGEAYRLLSERADELKAKMAALKPELDKAQASFKFETGPMAEANKALEELGLTASQVQSGVSDSAQKALDAFDKAAVQFGNDSEQMSRIFQAALAKMDSPEAVEALRGRLETLGKQAGLTGDEIGKIGEKAPDAAAKVSAAFAKIGVDVNAATTGISSKAKEAFGDWAAASAAAKDAGIDDSRLIRAGFEEMMGKLASKAEFEAFRAQLRASGDEGKLTREQLERLGKAAKDGAGAAKTAYEGLAASLKAASEAADFSRIGAEAQAAFEAGTISAAQYDQMMAQVREGTAQVAAASADMGNKAEGGHRRAASAANEHAAAAQKAADAQKELASATKSAGAATEEGTRKVTDHGHRISQVHGALKLTREEMVNYSKAWRGVWIEGQAGWDTSKRAAQEMLTAIGNARKATEALSAATSNGTVNVGMLGRATAAASAAVGKLDSASLRTLNQSIDAAKQKLADLKNEARDARLSIEAELAAANGNDEMSHQLENQRKLNELREKAAQADANGQSDVAAEYQQALALQQQLYQKQRAQREQQKRDDEAAARARQQADWSGTIEQAEMGGDPVLSEGDVNAFVDALQERDNKVVDAAVKKLMQQLQDAARRAQ